MLPPKLQKKLEERAAKNVLRKLPVSSGNIDFLSNDYLGFSNNSAFAKAISERAQALLAEHNIQSNGATGSRLLSGNHKLYELAESMLLSFHKSEAALMFNSGYDANIGLFQSVPQRGDIIIYDEFIHASIRDGIQMSLARGYKFKHNDLVDLEKVVVRLREIHHLNDQNSENEMYLITESIFSMDGDSPDLKEISRLCNIHHIHLIVDEAHATGVIGDKGEGLVQELGLENEVFARIITFGKGIGAHGAAIFGSDDLKSYLVNYARSFIYTTGLPPHSVATVIAAYEQLDSTPEASKKGNNSIPVEELQSLINYFNSQLKKLELNDSFIPSNSAIHCAVISGVEKVKTLSRKLEKQNFTIKPILSPTVQEGQERLRICLHAYNTEEEINNVLTLIKEHI